MSITRTSRGGAAHWNGPALRLTSCDGSQCGRVWSNIRTFHMRNGWNDIAYNHGICPGCGTVHKGRGWGVRSGANGTSAANRDWHAWMVMVGVGEPFTDVSKRRLLELNREHRRRYGRARLTWHRAVRGGGTDCPGPDIIGWISGGPDMSITDGVDVMNATQEAKLDEVLDRLSDRERRGYLAREVDTVKQALGNYLASVGSGGERLARNVPSAEDIADAVVAKLPAGSVSPADVATAVAEELKRRL